MDPAELYKIAALALATSAISVTISKAKIFESLREWVASKNSWLGKLISCHYCTSHWVALGFTLIYNPRPVHGWFISDFFVAMFAIVAPAAIVSSLIIKLMAPKPDDTREQIEQLKTALRHASEKIRELTSN